MGKKKKIDKNKTKIVKCESFGLLSEVKKKPAKIFNRLF